MPTKTRLGWASKPINLDRSVRVTRSAQTIEDAAEIDRKHKLRKQETLEREKKRARRAKDRERRERKAVEAVKEAKKLAREARKKAS